MGREPKNRTKRNDQTLGPMPFLVVLSVSGHFHNFLIEWEKAVRICQLRHSTDTVKGNLMYGWYKTALRIAKRVCKQVLVQKC